MAINVKKILADAIIKLSYKKSLRKITVTDIIKEADVGHQTFYNHFRDKNDLIFWVFQQTIRDERRIVETEGHYAYLFTVYSRAKEYQHFLTQAVKLTGQNSLTQIVYKMTYKFYKKYVVLCLGTDTLTAEYEYALEFNAHGASAGYVKWIIDGMPYSPDELARNALYCMPACITTCLETTRKK